MFKSSSEIERNYTIEDLEELLDNIPYEIYIKSINGKYKYVNKTAIDKSGLKKEEIINKNDFEIRSYNKAKICVESDREVINFGNKRFVESKTYVDNVETSYEIFKTLLFNNKKEKVMIGGISKFIVEDKGLCGEIIKNSKYNVNSYNTKETYKTILDKLKDSIYADSIALYIFDEQTKSMKIKEYIDNEEKYCKEYSLGENIDNYYSDIKITEKGNSDGIKYIYVIRNNTTLIGCMHIFFKKYPITIKEENIKYACMLISFNEKNRILTEMLNKEKELKLETQSKLQMIIDNIVDIYAIVKKVDDKLMWIEISKRCKEIIGWNIDELNSKNYLEFIHPKDKKRVKFIIEENKKSSSNLPFTMKTKNKRWLTIEAKFTQITDNLYMIVAQDNSKLIELKKDTESLKQAMELESLKSEFFANISHEFKTPLNIILSTVQLIMSYIDINNEYPSIETFNKYIKSIRQNSYRLLKLANNMIDTTKIEGGFYQININNYNIVEIVENIVQSLASYIKNSKRNIVFDTIEEEIILACDPDQIERVILNLLSNAMKFTSDDGNIYVSIESDQPFNRVLIRIGNDGQPLDIKDSKKIFKRFTQSESLLTRRIEGSGIGLSISKALMEMHKGDIYVNTKVKKGTEFCIELPIRKIMNCKEVNIREKSRIAKIEKFHIEFSDIYDLDNKIIEKNNINI